MVISAPHPVPHGPFMRQPLSSMYPLQGAQHLVPLVSWVQGLTFEHLEPLLKPCRKFAVACLERTMDEVPAFKNTELPELQRLRLLWLEYVVPLVNEVDTACKHTLLKDVQSVLKSFLVLQMRDLLKGVKLKLQRVSAFQTDVVATVGSAVILIYCPLITWLASVSTFSTTLFSTHFPLKSDALAAVFDPRMRAPLRSCWTKM